MLLYWLNITLFVILLDQLTKFVMARNAGVTYSITPFLNLTWTMSPSAVADFLFSVSNSPFRALTRLSIAVALFATYLLARYRSQKLFCVALSLILGGVLSNAIECRLYIQVSHFIDFHLQGWHFPPFNIADTAITCGAFLLIFYGLQRVRAARS